MFVVHCSGWELRISKFLCLNQKLKVTCIHDIYTSSSYILRYQDQPWCSLKISLFSLSPSPLEPEPEPVYFLCMRLRLFPKMAGSYRLRLCSPDSNIILNWAQLIHLTFNSVWFYSWVWSQIYCSNTILVLSENNIVIYMRCTYKQSNTYL